MNINALIDERMDEIRGQASEEVDGYNEDELAHHALNWLRDFAPNGTRNDWVDWMEEYLVQDKVQAILDAYADAEFERQLDEESDV
jgi:lysyl-tRNA synthetase class I